MLLVVQDVAVWYRFQRRDSCTREKVSIHGSRIPASFDCMRHHVCVYRIKWDRRKKVVVFLGRAGPIGRPIVARMPALVLIEDMEWTDVEQAVLARAETLRSTGRRSEAANLVAAGCVLPQNFSDRDVLRAGKSWMWLGGMWHWWESDGTVS